MCKVKIDESRNFKNTFTIIRTEKEKRSLKTLCFKMDCLGAEVFIIQHSSLGGYGGKISVGISNNRSAYRQAPGCRRLMALGVSALSLKVGERELTPKDSILTILCRTL